MGIGKKLLVLTALVGVAAVVYLQLGCCKHEIPPHFLADGYYGQKVLKANEPAPKDATEVKKFTINVDEAVLTDLKQRLKQTRYVEPLAGEAFNYGFNANTLKKVVDYWLTKYDWRKHEKEMNKYDHFKTQIEGLDVHFVHLKPANAKSAKRVVPLLIVHGWPGSFYEYMKSIPLLTAADKGVAFELVIPSIPGYGFSEAPKKSGFTAPHAARMLHKLMTRLGYKEYYYHGGDWGSAIGRYMSIMYPDSVLGFHSTFLMPQGCPLVTALKVVIGKYLPSLVHDNPDIEAAKLPLSTIPFMLRESGYMHLQATKPDTVGASLTDSPAGLAAYILEKFSTWTNKENVNKVDGGLTEKFTYDELLTNVMIYWVTNTAASSARLYETVAHILQPHEKIPLPAKVPVGYTVPPHELLTFPKFVLKCSTPGLIHYNHLPKGGHFAAFEEPQLVSNEIREFVVKCIELKEAKEREAAKAAKSQKK